MKIEDFKKLLTQMTEEEIYEMLKELSVNRAESMSETKVRKVRERAKKKNLAAYFETLSSEDRQQLIDRLKNATS